MQLAQVNDAGHKVHKSRTNTHLLVSTTRITAQVRALSDVVVVVVFVDVLAAAATDCSIQVCVCP